MKIIAGLGNIGREYAGTRHNAGFMVADELARRWGLSDAWRTNRDAEYVEYRVGAEKIILLKPTTYMNLSGNAVGAWAHFYNVAPKDVAVIHDDMDLPVGSLRIRKKGSSGGHNGIKSILNQLGTDAFARFRLGIGHPAHEQQAVIQHVLQRFQGADKQAMDDAVAKAADAVEYWLERDGDTDAVMQKFNTKPKTARKRAEKAAAAGQADGADTAGPAGTPAAAPEEKA
ncbi:MAG: aminoacyl-tRNA hydrolase [Succiniclasticum sp.]|jgi:PTH1 family peptidyl-tRNA hydrolase